MAGDYLQGNPGMMRAFEAQAPSVDFGGVGAGGGGGMTELAAFVAAHEPVSRDFQTFVQAASTGVPVFKQLATTAADWYETAQGEATADIESMVRGAGGTGEPA